MTSPRYLTKLPRRRWRYQAKISDELLSGTRNQANHALTFYHYYIYIQDAKIHGLAADTPEGGGWSTSIPAHFAIRELRSRVCRGPTDARPTVPHTGRI
jgi:hypothetical protein